MNSKQTISTNDVLIADIKSIAEFYGYESQEKMLFEEMAELTQALCKSDRIDAGASKVERMLKLDSVIEEIADVTIMLEQIKMLMNISNIELRNKMRKKVDRQLERMARQM